MEDSLNKRYIVKLASSVVSGIVNASILAMVPTALGPLAFGNFTYLTQFFTQVIAFLDAGTSTALFTRLSAKKNNQQLLVFYSILSLVIFSLVNLGVLFVDFLTSATTLVIQLTYSRYTWRRYYAFQYGYLRYL